MNTIQLIALGILIYVVLMAVFASYKRLDLAYFMVLPFVIIPFLLLYGIVYLFSLVYKEHNEF